MNLKHRVQGRISQNFSGLGTATPDMVEKRAREIARINGREESALTDADWEEARRELTGATNENRMIDMDAPEPESTVTRLSEPPGSRGAIIPTIEPADEQTYAEQLVQEGVQEAEHDRMVEGTKHEKNQS